MTEDFIRKILRIFISEIAEENYKEKKELDRLRLYPHEKIKKKKKLCVASLSL